MKSTKEDDSTSDEQVEVLSIEYNIHYIDCVGSLIYLLSTKVDLYFAVHKLENFHQILVKYTLKVWYTCWDISWTTRIWDWDIMPRYMMNLYLNSWDKLALILRTNWWCSLIPSGRTLHILAELQDHILCFIKVDQLIISHMFQVQLLNQVLKVSTIWYEIHEWI